MRLTALAAAAALATLPALVASCGFTIHMLVSHRAFSRFASTPLRPAMMDDLAENTGSLYAGSPCAHTCAPAHACPRARTCARPPAHLLPRRL